MRQTEYQYLWVLGAVCPETGRGEGLLSPRLNTRVVQVFLREFSATLPADEHAVMLWDGAGFHTSGKLQVPDKAGTNYSAASGTVTFAVGQATQTVQVTTLNDSTPEKNVDFELIATPAGGTSIMGLATILTDNTSISVSGASAIEGSNTMKFLDHFVSPGSGGLSRARGSVFGPDGYLYVASADTNAILRYDPAGEFINAFVPSSSGGLNSPVDVAFGPDGNLYVSSFGNNEVLSYDGSSGAFLGIVASGLSSPYGITFGPDGSLYIANQGTNEVLRYNNSGLSAFVTAESGGLSQPRKAVFGPDGNLYVASNGTSQVLRYDGTNWRIPGRIRINAIKLYRGNLVGARNR